MTDAARALGLDPDELAACVSCGLCLPHCPTWRITGEEAWSPRGRITLMRSIEAGADATPDVLDALDGCVQCRGCETACPSGVPFGHLMEDTRAALVAGGRARVPWWERLGLRALGHHRLLLAGTRVAAVAQRLGLVPARVALPRLPVRPDPPLRATGADVWLYPGCVMDAWQRPVHRAVLEVLGRMGVGVALPEPGREGCCGALHAHAGLRADAERLARRTIAAFGGDAPILVDSAGCGAAMKDYGRLLGAEGEAFAARVVDVHEWLAARAGDLPSAVRPVEPTVAVQDPCHLRHVQRAHGAVRAVLAPYAELVELDDEGLCCGAGGAWSALHPDEADAIRRRKLEAVARSGAGLVASANPGCALHLAAAGLDVRHPIELVAAATEPDHPGDPHGR